MEALEFRTRPNTAASQVIAHAAVGEADRALWQLAEALEDLDYRFTCITPDTHARVAARRDGDGARTLRDVFGWSLPFDEGDLPSEILHLLREARAVYCVGGRLKSLVRFATFKQTLLVHSAWPTNANDSVFFGPDTYRFASLIEQALSAVPPRSTRTVVDVGCGTGAGGILVAQLGADEHTKVLFTDINEQALRYARINALHAAVPNFSCLRSDVLSEVRDPIDLIIANPPYLLDPEQRAYRHGGGSLGTGLSVRIINESMQRLSAGGQLILYTASPIVDGVNTLQQQLIALFDSASAQRAFTYEYREIDPDVFGLELDHPAYARVERIAVVGLTLRIS